MKTSWTGQPVLSFVKEGGPFAKKKKISFGSGLPDGLRGWREKKWQALNLYVLFPHPRHDQYGNLYFKSYYWANQIFNLNKYYREATSDDIKDFCSNEWFSIDDIDSVAESCNNWTRRKIAYILDSGVLENNSVDEIIKSAKKLNLKIDINEENKIIFPDDKDSQKELLSYLAEEIYRGNLTDGVYLTNSKRPL